MSVLWTLGRHLEGALAQRLPALSLAGIFLAGSWVGALASANLNKSYVTCGASAGVCALLGELGWGAQGLVSARGSRVACLWGQHLPGQRTPPMPPNTAKRQLAIRGVPRKDGVLLGQPTLTYELHALVSVCATDSPAGGQKAAAHCSGHVVVASHRWPPPSHTPSPPLPPSGATWADQLLWPKRYVSQAWTVLVLLAITGIFVVMSLLPLLDPWYMCSALLAGARRGAHGLPARAGDSGSAAPPPPPPKSGALPHAGPVACTGSEGRRQGAARVPRQQPSSQQPRSSRSVGGVGRPPLAPPAPPAGFFALPVPSLVPRSRRGQRGARRWLAVQCVCACLVVVAATLGAVGVATKANLSSAGFLYNGSCVTFGRWQCLPAGASPNGCLVVEQDAGQAPLLRCPSVRPPPPSLPPTALLAAPTGSHWRGGCVCCCILPLDQFSAPHAQAADPPASPCSAAVNCLQGIVSQLPNSTAINLGDTDSITQLCFQYCALSGGAAGDAGSPPPLPALPIGGPGAGANVTAPGAGSCGNSTVGVTGPVLC